MGVAAPGPPRVPDGLPEPTARVATVIGVTLYAAGTLAFIGIAVAFFEYRLYDTSNDSRVAFLVLFAGLFATVQGLVFMLAARHGEARRQSNYLIDQLRAMGVAESRSSRLPPRDGE